MLPTKSGRLAVIAILYCLCVGSVILRAQVPIRIGVVNQTGSLPEGDEKALVVATCTQCHGLGPVLVQRKGAAQWSKTVSDMVSRGAQVLPDEIGPISEYLARGFGPGVPMAGPASEKAPAQKTFSAVAEQKASDALPEGGAKAVIVRSCSECHALSKLTTQNKDEAGWLASVKDMVRLGAMLRPDEVTLVVAYLSKNFGPQSSPSVTGASGVGQGAGASGAAAGSPAKLTDASRLLPDGEGKGLVLANCIQCHGLQEITGQRKDAENWRRTVHDMVSRGAQVSWAEADLITSYLAERLGKRSK